MDAYPELPTYDEQKPRYTVIPRGFDDLYLIIDTLTQESMTKPGWSFTSLEHAQRECDKLNTSA